MNLYGCKGDAKTESRKQRRRFNAFLRKDLRMRRGSRPEGRRPGHVVAVPQDVAGRQHPFHNRGTLGDHNERKTTCLSRPVTEI